MSLLGNPNTLKKKFQVADLFLELLNTKGPKWYLYKILNMEKSGANDGGTEAGESGFTRFHFKNCGISPPNTVVRKLAKKKKTGDLTVTTHGGSVLHNPIRYLVSDDI